MKLILMVLALFSSHPSSAPVPHFELIQERGHYVRVPSENLPFRLYSSDPRYADLVAHAVREWNAAGAGRMFEQVDTPAEADFTIDWSGRGLPSDCAGMCAMGPCHEGVEVRGLSMDPNNPDGRGNMAQVLIHELGHALGLGHSADTRDAMFELTHPDRTEIDHARLSERDRQALIWLYARKTGFLPIRARG